MDLAQQARLGLAAYSYLEHPTREPPRQMVVAAWCEHTHFLAQLLPVWNFVVCRHYSNRYRCTNRYLVFEFCSLTLLFTPSFWTDCGG